MWRLRVSEAPNLHAIIGTPSGPFDFDQSGAAITPAAGHRIGEELVAEDDIRRALESLATSYGFKGYMVMSIPGKEIRTLKDATLMTNIPGEFIRGYDEARLLVGSPVVDRLRRTTIPFTYDTRLDSRRRTDGKGMVLVTLFERVSLGRGLYIPVHDARGMCGAVAFGGDRELVSAMEIKQLTFVVGGLFNRLSEVRASQKSRWLALSKREVECLYWAAEGKTTSEMARILGLSDYTVNHYINRATRKLDSVNRVQTVAKAFRAGLIN